MLNQTQFKWQYPYWYSLPSVKFEIIKFTQNREFRLGIPKHEKKGQKLTKAYRVHNTKGFEHIMTAYNHKRLNIFTSVAKYTQGVPFEHYNQFEHVDHGEFYKDKWKKIKEYDFFIDIDAPSHEDIEYAYLSAIEIKALFDKHKTPYYLRFSGKGFHFVIPDDKIPITKNYNPKESNNIYSKYLKIAKRIKEECSELVDLRIYESNRKIKIPYTLALYQDQEYLCLPFNSNAEFENFDLQFMKPEHWIKMIRDRYQTLFNAKGDATELLKWLNLK